MKTFIFDIDGILCSTKKLHEIAIIKALKESGIEVSEEYHRLKLDGLPTKVKLNILEVKEELRDVVSKRKQVLTFEMAERFLKKDPAIKELFQEVKNKGYNIGICSNSIRPFSELVLKTMELESYVDCLLTNEDVKNPKPDPEMYTKCMIKLWANPDETTIFEDSKFGLDAAFKSGANVCYIKDPSYLVKKVKERL